MILHTLMARPGLALFTVEGQLDFASAPAVRSAIEAAAERGRYADLAIDLRHVSKADRKGVAALAAAARRLRTEHPAMCIVAVCADRWLKRALGAGAVPVCESGREALAYLNAAHAA
jgi:anti-anti-sigma factor